MNIHSAVLKIYSIIEASYLSINPYLLLGVLRNSGYHRFTGLTFVILMATGQ
jgi:hypothetical protein